MNLIAEFVSKVLSEEGSFTLNAEETPFDGGRKYSFLQEKVGAVRFIYAAYGWGEDFFASLEKKPKLIAIVQGEVVYFVDECFFGFDARNNVEKYGKRFTAYVQEQNRFVAENIFPSFYEKLEKGEVREEVNCKSLARNAVISQNPDFYAGKPKLDGMFNSGDVVKILCGFMVMEDEAIRRLEQDRDEWVRQKAEYEKIKEFMAAPDLCQNWEREIAGALRGLDAKNVTVEFTYNEKAATGKMEPGKIINILMQKGSFSEWDFSTGKEGEAVMKTLGVDRWSHALRSEHITKITYSRKTLYAKNPR